MFITNRADITASKKLTFKNSDLSITLKLRGIIYYGDFHFTARVFASDGSVWYHDGIATGRSCQDEGTLSDLSDADLTTCYGRQASIIIYSHM
jgi:hypothetical protein